ncbi:hypothetical protein [Amycolatopsis sp. lyj-23]|uniref:hypothetical protein n=1 Tax=Amycolatopsis sp. lyj-23 TaxID=2789283 RepID=UPI0039788E11
MHPTLALPRIARGIDRDGTAAPASLRDGPGLDAARADCRKLRGPARDMCYKALAAAKRP